MSEQFTSTELELIALVLNQNADRYDDYDLIRDTADKAREMQGDSSE